jgi:hypothetical protein
MNRYWIESEDLWVADDARILWRGRPDGKRPGMVTPLPDGDAIVMLAGVDAPRDPFGKPKAWANLIRVQPTGTVVWRAHPIENSGGDCWVGYSLRVGGLQASTWSGYSCELDLQTGRILSKSFTK